jgi:hypothetical protein
MSAGTNVSTKKFLISTDLMIPSLESVYFLGVTDKSIKFLPLSVQATGGPIVFQLFEDCETSDDGTLVSPVTVDRTSDATPLTLSYASPTVTNEGVLVIQDLASGDNKSSDSIAEVTELKLKANTKYLYKITNNSNQDETVFVNFKWSEDQSKYNSADYQGNN